MKKRELKARIEALEAQVRRHETEIQALQAKTADPIVTYTPGVYPIIVPTMPPTIDTWPTVICGETQQTYTSNSN